MGSRDSSTQPFSSPFLPTKQVAVIPPPQPGGSCSLTEHSGDFKHVKIMRSFFSPNAETSESQSAHSVPSPEATEEFLKCSQTH